MKTLSVLLLVATLAPAADSRAETRARIQSALFVPAPLPQPKTETYGQFEPTTSSAEPFHTSVLPRAACRS